MKPPRRSLAELINTDEPGIDLVREWAAGAATPVELLPVERAAGERALERLQITSRSPMGAIALETGGVWFDHGWIRLLGGGCERMPHDIATFNFGDDFYGNGRHRLPGHVVFGWDLLGGFFALKAPDGMQPASVCYFAPDTLRWQDLGFGFSAFVAHVCSGAMAGFYGDDRWPGHERDSAGVAGDRAFSIAPPPFAKGPPVGERSRRAVPVEELWSLYVEDLGPQLADEGHAS
ncbi:MAG: DUF2625 family protein [Planctomycetota bacterium]